MTAHHQRGDVLNALFKLKVEVEMRIAYVVTLLLMFAVTVSSQQAQNDLGLPDLHTIKSITLSPSYSCRTPEGFQKGYEETALFLSAYSKQRNSPDLLFNGACRSEDYFQASTAGDDMALIADLGENISLEKLTAHDAVTGYTPLSATELKKPPFSDSAHIKIGHTYAVLLNKSEIRGLFVFTVTGYTQNKQVELRYAVKEYQILRMTAQSSGFDWSAANSVKR